MLPKVSFAHAIYCMSKHFCACVGACACDCMPLLKGPVHSTTACFDLYNFLSFKIIDKATSKFHLNIEEALHINWRKPKLNLQPNHLALTLSL